MSGTGTRPAKGYGGVPCPELSRSSLCCWRSRPCPATSQGNRPRNLPQTTSAQHFTKYEHLIPMRDGARLFTSVYVPEDL